ncbi:MAG TPA: antitoxin [Spirochaetota bacterium]|jgi:predicted DNA binding CopG/RHH family protein|nr:antitoxin [Spirochaetota bacterium]MBP9023860.1 antitoxin [Spirochaetota bacterium]HOA08484.1 antitoxin [Spirochaetota bacterium]HOH38500.1 antitoxin [Spirochaetota bacterium]HPJ13636.1 antitoxin [Spirochaetota bacterium]
MKKEYDFSKMKSIKNPYAKYLKKQITIKINDETIKYFKNLAKETGITYQNLINLYLSDCASSQKKIKINWKS